MTVDSTQLVPRPTLLTDGVTNATREHIARQSLPATTTVRRHLRVAGTMAGRSAGENRKNILRIIKYFMSIAF